MTSHPPAGGPAATGIFQESSIPETTPAAPIDAIVIGAGFGGICMGRALLRAGVERFLILERTDDIGGVWRDNRYPGAACDVPSHLYSFSFAPNPDWPRTFATQAEILAYLRDCSVGFGLAPHLRLKRQVSRARYDEASATWEVMLEDGASLHTRMLVSAIGLLGRPALPQIDGMHSFAGAAFHSSRWNHAVPLAGKRVAVIGTGASATQFIPSLAGQVRELVVFQRSPAWLKPRGDRAYPDWRRRLFRHLPLAMGLHRALIYAKYESRALAFTRFKGMMEWAVGQPFRRMLARDVADPVLRARLTPGYPIGCKRVLLSDDYLASLAHPEVRLVTEPIRRIVPRRVETASATVEVEPAVHRRFNTRLQRHLARTVWNGCHSWYLDRHGRNTTNWPGFSFTYRWLARHASLSAYRFASPVAAAPLLTESGSLRIAAPPGLAERLQAGFQRLFLRTCFRPLIGPPAGPRLQRALVACLAPLMPGVGGVRRVRRTLGGVPAEAVIPKAPAHGQGPSGAILYLHGGAFCLGNPASHRSITTRLASDAGITVWAPDYRLAPEHPCPAALDDALACYQGLLDSGIPAHRIVLAGDSAGGGLALALALSLRDKGLALPAGLALVSPLTDPSLSSPSVTANARIDPMVRRSWVAQGVAWYACPLDACVHAPLSMNLAGLPPILVQVGEQEILRDDAFRLAAHARACGVPCQLEEYAGRWHVFHLQAFYLRSAAHAIGRLAAFARVRVAETQVK
ncbi:flavin-containing monooxygenase [Massilia brevitalea]|uniref:flavin-containing monooxygenase n=1 Tax=Massilia brevitalea TaxID=442526 RepID=UPI002739795F|nr:alpha/beta hydrolase fold domain-containing protein [Massilia brevitalea]